MSQGFSHRSEIPLASAERLASSGITGEEIRARTRAIGSELAKKNILLVDLNDSTITISQYNRAEKLIREIYHTAGREGKLP